MLPNLKNIDIEKKIRELDSKKAREIGSFTILIIDDDKWLQRILLRYFDEWGFNTISAFDAYEGIALAVGKRPLMILLDIIMPELNGDQVLKILKTIECTKDIPIVMLSGNLTKELLKDTYVNGAAGFLSKLVLKGTLLKKIQECIEPEIFRQIRIQKLGESGRRI